MKKINQIITYLWLVLGVYILIQTAIDYYDGNTKKVPFMIGAGLFALGMFVFKLYFLKKVNNRNRNNSK